MEKNSVLVKDSLRQSPEVSKGMAKEGLLAYALYLQTLDGSRLDHLQRAIKSLTSAIPLLERDPLANANDKVTSLLCLGHALFSRFSEFPSRNFEDLSNSISFYQQAIQLVDEASLMEIRIELYQSLGIALQMRFRYLGKVPDVDGAVKNLQQAYELAQNTEAKIMATLTRNLGIAYQSRFERLFEVEDSELAREMLNQSMQHSNPSKPLYAMQVNDLGLSFLSWFKFQESSKKPQEDSLDLAIFRFEEAVKLSNRGHPEFLANLSSALVMKAEKIQVMDSERHTMVKEAVGLMEEAIALSDRPSCDHHNLLPKYLAKLGVCLHTKARFEKGQRDRMASIANSISSFRRALEMTPVIYDTERCELLLQLGEALHFCSEASGGRSSNYFMEGNDAFRKCWQSPTGPVMVRLQAAIRLAQISHRKKKWSIALDGYREAIRLLPQAAWIGQSITSRQRILASQPATLAADAAACAIQEEAYDVAIELLEQGRTIFWNQALELRPMELEDLHKKENSKILADQLEEVARELETRAFGDLFDPSIHATNFDREESAQRHRSLAQRWQSLVDDVRKLPDFTHFLTPRDFTYLQEAANYGPVIIVNASSYRCDALIIKPSTTEPTKADSSLDGPIIHIHLPSAITKVLSRVVQELIKRCCRWDVNSFGRKALGLGHQDGGLRDAIPFPAEALQDAVLSPILEELSKSLPELERQRSRIWWCPTGVLTYAPLHMLSVHKGRVAATTFISSYTINLTSLIRARQQQLPVGDFPKVLIIGGGEGLKEVQTEITAIQNILRETGYARHITVLDGPEMTVGNVLTHLPQANWVHFACHGGDGGAKPLNAALYFGDRELTLPEIARQDFPLADFAFFNACNTGVTGMDGADNDLILKEESLHLAAAFQFAGFRSIIATRELVFDSTAAALAPRVYDKLVGNNPSNAAEALDTAVRALIAQTRLTDTDIGIPLDYHLLPYVHYGI